MSVSAGFDRLIIPALVGATAVGKTAAALELAEQFNLEIVSCDSRQIYKYLDIGTAKPTPGELGGQPYHLIDFVEPDRSYSAVRYRDAARETIADIVGRGRMPIIVGGAGLYLKALISGFFTTPEADASYREELSRLDPAELHARLEGIDPETAAEVPVGNRVRMIRALEIFHMTGRPKSELKRTGVYPSNNFEFLVFGLTLERKKLYQLINLRVDKMFRDGLMSEIETLIDMGYRNSPVLASTVGYNEALDHLGGRSTLEQCLQLIKQKTRNYAKRQITWFKRTENQVSVDMDESGWKDFLFAEIGKLKLDSKLL
ncbi:MAG: tRNA (adenosine(37)-N6)-dimethylallyltransferase MiaA [candidate division Zixibacteria bacterium]|nr:tRNA (adenosine(37)-N6)-dimethylallyltransferase MiaA [candidate division Zixibacteria bacterium]